MCRCQSVDTTFHQPNTFLWRLNLRQSHERSQDNFVSHLFRHLLGPNKDIYRYKFCLISLLIVFIFTKFLSPIKHYRTLRFCDIFVGCQGHVSNVVAVRWTSTRRYHHRMIYEVWIGNVPHAVSDIHYKWLNFLQWISRNK